MRRLALGLVTLTSVIASAQKPAADPNLNPVLTAEAIMTRVAANQDRTEAERAHFVYLQHAHVQSRKGSSVMCDEVTDARITPSPTGQQQQLLTLSGHVRADGRIIRYTALSQKASAGAHPDKRADDLQLNLGDNEVVLDADANDAPVAVKNTDIDLVQSMRRKFTSDTRSKDGLDAGLFPLTTSEQRNMVFELKGREPKNGHDAFHITFRPRDKNDFSWKGEAWIDAVAFQPVVVRTALSRSIPLGVRVLLGTNVPGLGFTVIYAPQGAVWFPASFGTEFKIHVLFAFHRQIVVNVENRQFERTHVTTVIHSEAAGNSPPPSAPPNSPR